MSISFYQLRIGIGQELNLIPAHNAFLFPGGEAHINLDPITASTQVADLRGADSRDLMKLAMWANATHAEKRILFLPYLPGARMDRGNPFGAKVYADFINSLQCDLVVTVDPHSDVAPSLYENIRVIPPARVMPPRIGYSGIIIPDKGAKARAESIAQMYALPTFQADKTRDFATGKLSGFTMLDKLDPKDRYLIVDDICDGGGTFLGLAEATGLPREQLGLWVTHGIFSSESNFAKLVEVFSWIGTTDSWYPWTSQHLTVVPLLPYLKEVL